MARCGANGGAVLRAVPTDVAEAGGQVSYDLPRILDSARHGVGHLHGEDLNTLAMLMRKPRPGDPQPPSLTGEMRGNPRSARGRAPQFRSSPSRDVARCHCGRKAKQGRKTCGRNHG